jgi:hypothetical protein
MNHIQKDFLCIFKNEKKTDTDNVIKDILYTNKSSWIIQQNKFSENYVEIIENNVKELLLKLNKTDIIKYIINDLINICNRFNDIEKKFNVIFLQIFFQNIKTDILKKIIKNIIHKNNKYNLELINTIINLNSIIEEKNILHPLINEFNNLTIQKIQNYNLIDSYKIFLNNNTICNNMFHTNLDCINIIICNYIEYIKQNETSYLDTKILFLINNIDYINNNKKKELINVIENYLLNLHKNITDYNLYNNKLLKNIIYHLDYIHQTKELQKIINFPLIIKTNINNIIHNDDILKYFMSGISDIIKYGLNNVTLFIFMSEEIILNIYNIIFNVITYLKFMNNIDIVLQYYYEYLKIRIKYYLINCISSCNSNIYNVENKLIEYLELINYSKLRAYNDIYNCLNDYKTTIDLMNNNETNCTFIVNTHSKANKYNINIPSDLNLSADVDYLNKIYKEKYNFNNRKLELDIERSDISLKVNNITISGELIPMSILYCYGYNTDIEKIIGKVKDMFNNENEEFMNYNLNILKYNNLLIDNKLNIPTCNIDLKKKNITVNVINDINIKYDRDIITKCYVMKTAKLLKNNIEQEELFKLTKQNIKYFELNKNIFEDTLKYCLEKEYLTINNSGLIDF